MRSINNKLIYKTKMYLVMSNFNSNNRNLKTYGSLKLGLIQIWKNGDNEKKKYKIQNQSQKNKKFILNFLIDKNYQLNKFKIKLIKKKKN